MTVRIDAGCWLMVLLLTVFIHADQGMFSDCRSSSWLLTDGVPADSQYVRWILIIAVPADQTFLLTAENLCRLLSISHLCRPTEMHQGGRRRMKRRVTVEYIKTIILTSKISIVLRWEREDGWRRRGGKIISYSRFMHRLSYRFSPGNTTIYFEYIFLSTVKGRGGRTES